MTQLTTLDELLTNYNQPVRNNRNVGGVSLDEMLRDTSVRRSRLNEIEVQRRTKYQRDSPIAGGGVFGGVATGLATAGGSLLAPALRWGGYGGAADDLQMEMDAANRAQQENLNESIKKGELGNTPLLGAVRRFVNRYLARTVCLITQATGLGLVCAWLFVRVRRLLDTQQVPKTSHSMKTVKSS